MREGKGHVVIHAGGSSFYEWAEYQELIGGASWKNGVTDHGPRHAFLVRIAAKNHPVMQGLKDFYIVEELWHRTGFSDKVTVLAEAFSAENKGGTGEREPIATANEFGTGRNVSLLLGHDSQKMGNPGFQVLLLRAVEWAASGKVTIEAPTQLPATAHAAQGVLVSIDELLEKIGQYEYGQDRKYLLQLQSVASAAQGEASKSVDLAEKIIASLENDESLEGKKFLCEQLGVLGDKAAVPMLVKLVDEPELRPYALEALERIGGKAAREALRNLLQAQKGESQVAVILSLGRMKDEKAIRLLKRQLETDDAKIQLVAIRALASIGTLDAMTALEKVKVNSDLQTAQKQAMLRCALNAMDSDELKRADRALEKLTANSNPAPVRQAATQAWINVLPKKRDKRLRSILTSKDAAMQLAAVQSIRQKTSDAATAILAEQLSRLTPRSQSLAISIIAQSKNTKYLSALIAAAESANPTVRQQALRALGAFNDTQAATVLIAKFPTPNAAEKQVILDALLSLNGSDINKLILEQVRSAKQKDASALIDLLVRREAHESVPQLILLIADTETKVANSAAQAVGALGASDHCAELFELLKTEPSRSSGKQICAAIVSICKRQPGSSAEPIIKALPGVIGTNRTELIQALSNLQSDQTLNILRKELRSKDVDLRIAAIRALSAWDSPASIDALLGAAQATKDLRENTLAVRGAGALIKKHAKEFSDKEFSQNLAQAIDAAQNPEEQITLLAIANQKPSLPLLQILKKEYADGKVRDAFLVAQFQVAQSLSAEHKPEARSVFESIQAQRDNEELARQAQLALLMLDQKVINLAYGAKAESPDGLEKDGEASGDNAAIDGDPKTYWDEENGKKLYRLSVTLKQKSLVSALRITGYIHHNFAPKDFEILCDDQVVKVVKNAQYKKNELSVKCPSTECQSVELKITGYYGRSPAIRELEILGVALPEQAKESAASINGSRQWKQDDVSAALMQNGKAIWQFNYSKERGKTFFHPVALPGGDPLTWAEPPDHVWHYGLWFCWKYLNIVNYWEEDRKTRKSDGAADWSDVRIETADDFSANISMKLNYHPQESKEIVMTEKRTIHVSAPQAEGSYHMDWNMAFTAGKKDVVIDRTPLPDQPNGKMWGGYAGLSFRGAKAFKDWQVVATSKTGSKQNNRFRFAAPAAELNGELNESEAGIAILDHPENLNAPSRWYVITDQKIPFSYINAAVVHDDPFTLKAGESFRLRYRVIIHPDRWDTDRLKTELNEFTKSGAVQ